VNQKTILPILFAIALLVFLSWRLAAQQPSQGQGQSTGQDDMGGMDMSKMDHMHHDTDENPDAARSANDSMSHEHMEMSAHMHMTALRPENPDDEKRAEQILATLRPAIEKYKDYKAALADGYQIFLPNIPQPQYHFTNWRYAFEAQFVFDAAHPTSLLYKKTPDGYQLLGAMYTAPKKDTEDQLNERVPLSVARWHKHINFCLPPKGQQWWQVDWKKFGMAGSIATEDACNEAGGRWVPQIYGWMVHVYPYESDPEKIWAH
jgi:hypothetical protein